MAFTVKMSGAKPALSISNRRCLACEFVFEVTALSDEFDEKDWIEDTHGHVVQCPECEGSHSLKVFGTTAAPHTINEANSDYSERQRPRLWKRSNEHFQKKGRDEAIHLQREQFGRVGLK